METQLLHSYLNTAKRLSGISRIQVNTSTCPVERKRIKKTIEKIVSDLTISRHYFKSIGKGCEVDNLTIYYQSLLARLNSS